MTGNELNLTFEVLLYCSCARVRVINREIVCLCHVGMSLGGRERESESEREREREREREVGLLRVYETVSLSRSASVSPPRSFGCLVLRCVGFRNRASAHG